MKEPIDDGGQAFPRAGALGDGWEGMSLRDYFAAQALAGLAGNEQWITFARGFYKGMKEELGSEIDITARGMAAMATQAYVLADAMMAERAK